MDLVVSIPKSKTSKSSKVVIEDNGTIQLAIKS